MCPRSIIVSTGKLSKESTSKWALTSRKRHYFHLNFPNKNHDGSWNGILFYKIYIRTSPKISYNIKEIANSDSITRDICLDEKNTWMEWASGQTVSDNQWPLYDLSFDQYNNHTHTHILYVYLCMLYWTWWGYEGSRVWIGVKRKWHKLESLVIKHKRREVCQKNVFGSFCEL